MANFIFNPIAASSNATLKADFQSQQVSNTEEASFSQYIEKEMSEPDERRSLLGVNTASNATTERTSEDFGREDELLVSSIGELLQQLMQKLKELSDDKEIGVGEWKFLNLEINTLENLAEKAGMDSEEIQSLVMSLQENDGEMNLLDFFAAMEKHFSELGTVDPVTAPETSLPLLQTFLDKMGVPAEQIEMISEASVNELGGFDLNTFLKGLEQLDENMPAIPLSEWETKQLQDMLQSAGVSDEMLEQLFPEKVTLMQKAVQSLEQGNPILNRPDKPVADLPTPLLVDTQVHMDLDRLKSLLNQTISDVDAQNPKADVPAFLGELEKILGQAGFNDKNVGWSPVVQESLAAAYKDLQKMVDMAKVRVEKIQDVMAEEEGLVQEWLASGDKERVLPGGDAMPSVGEEPLTALTNTVEEMGVDVATTTSNPKATVAENTSPLVSVPLNDGQFAELIDNKIAAARMRIRPEIQQLTFEQISQNVMRGLKNSQHQLTLTLYPRELGEVKVDMVVKENQVSLSLLMETPKVKELMEGNMQEFKDSMEQKGFILEQFSVSVDQGGEESEKYKEQFEMLAQMVSEKERKVSLEELTELVGQNYDLNDHDGQISLIA